MVFNTGVLGGDAFTAGPANNALGIVKTGASTLILSANNLYAGTTVFIGGVLQANHAGALSSVGAISFGGGTPKHNANNTVDYSARFGTAFGQSYKRGYRRATAR